MKLASAIALLAVPAVLSFVAPARAQNPDIEVEVGTGLICDTREQVDRFVTLYEGDMQRTVDKINAAESDPPACAISTIAYVRGRQLAWARSKDTSFQIVPILVLGIITDTGMESIKPTSFFSAFEVEETSI